LAVTVAYGSLFSSFTGELGAFKAEFYAFVVGAVADLAEFVFSCHAASATVGAGAFHHFWAFLTCDSANTNPQIKPFTIKKRILCLIFITAEILWAGKLYLPSLANIGLEKPMFCPSCGRQNKDTGVFCEYCGKGLPQKTIAPQIEVQPIAQANPTPSEHDSPKPRLSFNAKRGIVTGLLIIVVVLVVLAIYYPSIFHL